MKRMIAVILVLCALLTACGGEAAKSADLTALYATCQEILPEMSTLGETTMLNLYGIKAEDCVQAITAICIEGMRTDEIWLIEAKDAAALERIETLAWNRLSAKAAETVSYAPDQYAVVEKAQILTEGNYLALIVCPEVEELAAAFQAAFN